MTESFRAWCVHGADDMRIVDVPRTPLRPGWVRVRVLVVQPSVTECMLLAGERTYGHEIVARRLAEGPARLFGHEFSAVVTELGEGVASLAIGDRVAARGSHPDGIVGFDYPGALAQEGVFPATLFARLPESVSDTAGAAIQPLTDAVCAVAAADLDDRATAVVIGTGSMGLGCLQVALAEGVGRVIVVGRRAVALAMALDLGAEAAIDVGEEDPVARVRELTGGAGADLVFETAGGPVASGFAGNATLIQAAHMSRDRGAVVGVAFNGDGAYLPYDAFRFRGIQYRFPVPLDRPLFEGTVQLVASGQVRLDPLIGCVLDGLEEVPRAFALTADKRAAGLINPAQVRISAPLPKETSHEPR